MLLRAVGLEEPQPVTARRIVGQLAVDFGDLALAKRPVTFQPNELGGVAEALELAYRLLDDQQSNEASS
jgi:hypothetical protein